VTSPNNSVCPKACQLISGPRWECHLREDLAERPMEHRVVWGVGNRVRYLAWVAAKTSPVKDRIMLLLQDPLMLQLSDKELDLVVNEITGLGRVPVSSVTNLPPVRPSLSDPLAPDNGAPA
jgi:hypothetical protein